MIGSAKKMLLLSLGLLLSTVTVIRAEAPKVDDAPVNTEVPKVDDAPVNTEVPKVDDALVNTEVPKVDDAPVKTEAPKADDAPVKDEAPKADDAPVKDEDPKADDSKDGWFTSSWNATCGYTNDAGSFAYANPGKSILMLIGVIKSITLTHDLYSVFFGEEDKSVRRRPRFNSTSPRLDTTN